MLVRFPQTLYVTEHFQLGRFGQVVMSSGARPAAADKRRFPGAPALAMQAPNDLNRIIVDDELNNQNRDPILFGRGGTAADSRQHAARRRYRDRDGRRDDLRLVRQLGQPERLPAAPDQRHGRRRPEFQRSERAPERAAGRRRDAESRQLQRAQLLQHVYGLHGGRRRSGGGLPRGGRPGRARPPGRRRPSRRC